MCTSHFYLNENTPVQSDEMKRVLWNWNAIGEGGREGVRERPMEQKAKWGVEELRMPIFSKDGVFSANVNWKREMHPS